MAWLAAVGILLFAPLSHAAMIITVKSATYAPGTNGDMLEVTLTNNGGGAVTVAGFTFEISVGTSNLTFTAVDDSTVNTYVFAGHSFFGPDISAQPPTLPGQMLEGSDIYDTPNAGTSLANNATFDLGHVLFNLSSFTPAGPIMVSLVAGNSSLTDQNGGNIPFTTVDGTVTVTPEPATGALLLSGLLAIAQLRRVRRATSRYRKCA